jgi:DNA-directed RNA polymerase III subunit RPC1
MEEKLESKFEKVELCIPSYPETTSFSQLQISTQFIHGQYNPKPCSGGLNDNSLGSNEDSFCMTCLKNYRKCFGHFGFLKLFLPVFNIGYIKAIHGILQIICKNCSRVLIKNDQEYQKILRLVQILRKRNNSSRIKSFSLIIETCRRQKWCPHCGCKNGRVRKIGTWNFVYEIELPKKNTLNQEGIDENIKIYKKNIILDPLQVFIMFQRINRIDFELLDLDPLGTKPENFLLSVLPIPPLTIRPRVSVSSKFTSEDDLTIRLAEIQNLNLKLKKLFFNPQESGNIWENWGILQIESARYLNSEIFTGDTDSKNLTGIYQRLKGKNGRFRGSLGGKRVDF